MDILGTGAAQLNLLFQIGSYRNIVFDFGTDVSSWTFEFILRKNKGDRVKTISKTLGNGISFPVYQTDQIQVTFTSTNTAIQEGEYYWELKRTDVLMPIVNGLAYFSFDAPDGNVQDSDLEFTASSQTVELSVSNLYFGLAQGTYSTEITFDEDQDIYKDATGLSITFTIAATGNVNGIVKFVRLNKPTAVTFSGNWEAHSNSATIDSTKLNVIMMVFFTNWNGTGSNRVIYSNSVFTAV